MTHLRESCIFLSACNTKRTPNSALIFLFSVLFSFKAHQLQKQTLALIRLDPHLYEQSVSLWRRRFAFTQVLKRQECDLANPLGAHTSMLTQKYVVADWSWFGKGVELVEPFPGDVELQQAGLFHVGQSHDLLPLPHGLLTALSEYKRRKNEANKLQRQLLVAQHEKHLFTCRIAHRPPHSAPQSRGLPLHTGHQTRTTGRWWRSDSRLCSVHLRWEQSQKRWTRVGSCCQQPEVEQSRTSCGAVVANDWEQVVGGDLGWALFGQEGLHVEALQWEGHVATDLEGVHHLVPEAFQVDAQNLHKVKQTNNIEVNR